MKKLLIMAAAAGMVFASCTNDEADLSMNQGQKKQISFAAPITEGITRAEYGEIANPYPTTENFVVFGKRYTGSYTGWSQSTEAADEFLPAGEKTTYKSVPVIGNGWFTDQVHYFEKGFNYTFAGFSPYSITNGQSESNASTSESIAYGDDGLTVTGYTPGIFDSQVDFMFAKRIYDIDYSADLKAGGANNGNLNNYIGLDMVFQHALSSINFLVGFDKDFENLMKAAGYAAALDGFKIYCIKVTNVATKADFTENIGTQTKATYTSTPAWSNHSTPEAYAFFKNKSGISVPQGTAGKGQNVKELGGHIGLLIPQTFVTTDPLDPSKDNLVEIYWSHLKNGVEEKLLTKISLKDLTGGATEWAIGKRYTYRILFSKDVIYFAPTVEDWTDAENTYDPYENHITGKTVTTTWSTLD